MLSFQFGQKLNIGTSLLICICVEITGLFPPRDDSRDPLKSLYRSAIKCF